MEYWMEARALKPSLLGDLISMKPTKQVLSDELLSLNGTVNCVSSAEDFSVECFLDLSNGEFEDVFIQEEEKDEGEEEEEEEEEEEVEEQGEDDSSSNSCDLSSDSVLLDELTLPVDEIAELEWVSRFVDDSSLPELSLPLPDGRAKPENQTKPLSEPEAATPVSTNLSFPIPVGPRTKRSRNGKSDQRWTLCSLSSGFGLISTSLILTNTVQKGETVEKKPKTKAEMVGRDGSLGGNMFQRRCSHCGTHKTPQWRTGPLGSKTLCNACGVRYKSGRLCPQYRPISSPTFSSEIHSNSHRRVLELRKRKELSSEPVFGLIKPGQSL